MIKIDGLTHVALAVREPYIFARDPDGYQIEVWYEIPTRVDPRPSRRKRKV